MIFETIAEKGYGNKKHKHQKTNDYTNVRTNTSTQKKNYIENIKRITDCKNYFRIIQRILSYQLNYWIINFIMFLLR